MNHDDMLFNWISCGRTKMEDIGRTQVLIERIHR